MNAPLLVDHFQSSLLGGCNKVFFYSKRYLLFMKVILKLRVLQLLCGMCMYR